MSFAVIPTLLLLCGTALSSPLSLYDSDLGSAEEITRRQSAGTEPFTGGTFIAAGDNVQDPVQLACNWGGAFAADTDIHEASGTFVVPHQKIPASGNTSTNYWGAAWVGIGGMNCAGLIQGGVRFSLQDETASFNAWYEWFPNPSVTIDSIDVDVGDTITVVINAPTNTSGSVYVENVTSGQSHNQTFKDMGSVGGICQTTAEWIVESPVVPDVANFGSVTFTDSSYVHNAKPSGVANAKPIDQQQCSGSGNGELITQGQISSTGNIVVTYAEGELIGTI